MFLKIDLAISGKMYWLFPLFMTFCCCKVKMFRAWRGDEETAINISSVTHISCLAVEKSTCGVNQSFLYLSDVVRSVSLTTLESKNGGKFSCFFVFENNVNKWNFRMNVFPFANCRKKRKHVTHPDTTSTSESFRSKSLVERVTWISIS